MGALFDDFTLVQHHYAVHFLDGAQPVGYDNGRTVFHESPQGVLNQHLAFAVEGRGGFVQH